MADHQELAAQNTIPGGHGFEDTVEDILGTEDRVLGEAASGRGSEIGASETVLDESNPGAQQLATTTWQRLTVLPRLEHDELEGPRLVTESKKRYDHQSVLGEGASGEVGLALDQDIQRLVAVKRLKHQPSETPALMRFVDEIRLVGTLEHPNIVPIHDVGIDIEGHYYFVMKYVEGETLESIIAKLSKGDRAYHEKYTFDYRIQVFMKICEAIEFAHAKGVIHRDLKPANVMVGEHGEVMVMDWGIAKYVTSEAQTSPDEATSGSEAVPPAQMDLDDEVESTTSTPSIERMYETQGLSIIGTPAYMAPEQAMGRTGDLDTRTDVYSLSAMLYELLALTSYLPPKKTMKELIVAVITEDSKPPFFTHHPHQPRVPAQFSNFVIKGLAKEPDDRYQSVTAMRETLQRVTEGYFGVMCPVSMIKRPVHGLLHFIDRFPNLSLTLVVLLATSLVGGLIVALTR